MAAFWHNIGKPDLTGDWTRLWQALDENGVVTAGYGNIPLGKGHRTVARYQPGDRIFAYVNGFGLVGEGEAEGPHSVVRRTEPRNGSNHQHEASVHWRQTLELDRAVSSAEILTAGGPRHPRQTSQRISEREADVLAELLRRR